MATRHIPVLLDETVAALDLHKGDTAVDVTLGGGGHTRAMLGRVLPGGRVIASDADAFAVERFLRDAETNPILRKAVEDGSLSVTRGNFSDIGTILADAGVSKVNAILADFGFSSDQVDDPDRGFSFLADGPLDMRLDQEGAVTAADIVNGYQEERLADVIRRFGDEKKARKIAHAIVTRRMERPFGTTKDLAECVAGCFSEFERRKIRIHPATKTFQAIRMEVNEELPVIGSFLREAVRVLVPGGRLAVITFHSGEDALVKGLFAEMSKGCVCPPEFPECRCGRQPAIRLLSPRFVRPSEEEVSKNPRARSAKLRSVERI
ncbi:MAG: 16S rRNA (cytosine(1402)-N(4))-methyltransferase RsmH [Candidatus Moranbacteria bacterium]|nr:16S rRNA (cytosine(1402)-N(4))-methyltransferase RsmH [Candidatus Moranbacteria bacterium]